MRLDTFTRRVLGSIVSRRVSVALAMARLNVIRQIMYRTVFVFRSEGQARQLTRCDGFLTVGQCFTRLHARRGSTRARRITCIGRFLRCYIMRLELYLNVSIITQRVCLGAPFQILRLRGQHLTRSATTRSATNGRSELAQLLVARVAFCVYERYDNFVLNYEM